MASMVATLDRWLYPNHEANWDNQHFRSVILDQITRDDHVLDLGAGAGYVKQMRLRGHAGRVCGVDPDERVLQNPFLDEAKVGTGDKIPYNDNQFDVVISNNVLEHLAEPDVVFREAWRVLKPGGLFLAKTPNKWYYVSIIASVTPHWFHQWVNERRGRERADTFPTFYRANTPSAVRRLAKQTEFDVEQIQAIEGRPEYLRMTAPTYVMGWMYERFVNFMPGMSAFRAAIIMQIRKPHSAAQLQRAA